VLAAWGDLEHNTLSFVVSDPYSERFLSIAQADQRVTLVAVTLSDYLAYQYKGSLQSIVSSSAHDLEEVQRYVDDFCRLVTYVGIDAERYRPNFAGGPYTTITFELDSVFDQTPRVGAGSLLRSKSTS
jgi:hypothetical protein